MRLKAPQNETSEDQGLLRDQAGATMVMGIFMAMLLVGLIYYVWGIGDAVMVRERMQDASDTASFSAAVIHARGMNLISLMNMIMAALAVVGATLTVIGSPDENQWATEFAQGESLWLGAQDIDQEGDWR